MYEVGRICVKTAGREAGKYCVVVKKVDTSFVMVTGPREITGVKRRRCNVVHLEPILEKIKISSDASDSEVAKTLEKENIFEKLQIKKPDLEKIKKMRAEKEDKKEKQEKKKEKEKPKEDKKEKPKKKETKKK
ncbi:MAG: 50S ribosomal protein L14e [Nanoarchaeota archaeon]|nr:50S ribosomal protein L14e [Nanoarchaeota archaeon]MBU1135200.1 50S ribosomal protein L14e [Nanoarchaeota archaeon]MBU2519773.1 50S ribosomal protein L14e [Nanoarchaeota archaeon]